MYHVARSPVSPVSYCFRLRNALRHIVRNLLLPQAWKRRG